MRDTVGITPEVQQLVETAAFTKLRQYKSEVNIPSQSFILQFDWGKDVRGPSDEK